MRHTKWQVLRFSLPSTMIYGIAEMIMKVKEPIEQEYKLVKKGQIIYTYFHFASSEELTLAMIESGAVCLAYETVELPDQIPSFTGADE
jgi:alanine dehydrogenase